MNSAAYFTAAIPEPFRILGLSLKPLSLGRYRLLKRFDVAFVADGPANAESKDVILGVLICSQRVNDFLEWLDLHPKKRMKDLARWGRKVCPRARFCKLPIVGRFFLREIPSLIEKVQMFQAYIRESSQVPQYWNLSGDEGGSGAHWSHTVEVALRSEVGWSKYEIDEEPLSKALADYFKFAESQGAIRLMTPEEVEQGEANARIFAQVMEAGRN